LEELFKEILDPGINKIKSSKKWSERTSSDNRGIY